MNEKKPGIDEIPGFVCGRRHYASASFSMP